MDTPKEKLAITTMIFLVILVCGCKKELPDKTEEGYYRVIAYSDNPLEPYNAVVVPNKVCIIRVGIICDILTAESILPKSDWPSEIIIYDYENFCVVESEAEVHKIEYYKPEWAKYGAYYCWIKLKVYEPGKFFCYVVDDRTLTIVMRFDSVVLYVE